MNSISDRPPPNDLDAEMAVLGCLLLEPTGLPEAASVLTPSDFYCGVHRTVFEAILAVRDEGKPVDGRLLVRDLVRDRGPLAPDDRPWADVLRTLVGAVATPANLQLYAGMVRDKSRARQALHVVERVARAAYEDEAAVVDVLRNGLDHLQTSADCVSAGPLREGLGEAVQRLATRIDLERGEGGCLPWRIRELDEAGAYLRPGDFAVVAGMPGIGKSTWVLAWGLETARRIGPVLFVSLEMDPGQLREKVLLNESGVPDPHGRGLGPDDQALLSATAEALWEVPLLIPDHPPSGASALSSWLRDRIHRLRPVAVILDYLGMVQGEGENATAQTADVSKRLRTVARQTRVPIVAVHSLNRSSGSENRQPELRDLRQSGQIEFDATHVLFLWRPYDALNEAQRNRVSIAREEVWLLLRKARRGASHLQVALICDGARSRLLPKARGSRP